MRDRGNEVGIVFFFSLRGACLSMQLTNICFHSCHMSFGSGHRSIFDYGICSRSLKNLYFRKCLNCLILIVRGQLRS